MEALAHALRDLGLEAAVEPIDGRRPEGVVVVDSYRQRADAWARPGVATVAVDDLDRDLAVDLLVEPAPAPTRQTYRAGLVRAGLGYALLSPDLVCRETAPVPDEVHSVLVSAGGGGRGDTGCAVAAAIRAELRGARVQLVAGPWFAADTPHGVETVAAPRGLAELLADADLVVTAAGVTMLESLALGRPTVAFPTAPNQRGALDAAVRVGAVAAATVEGAARVAASVAGDAGWRRRLSCLGPTVVDGRGAARVAQDVATFA